MDFFVLYKVTQSVNIYIFLQYMYVDGWDLSWRDHLLVEGSEITL